LITAAHTKEKLRKENNARRVSVLMEGDSNSNDPPSWRNPCIFTPPQKNQISEYSPLQTFYLTVGNENQAFSYII
jgi:hypothetical protein